MFGDNVKKLSYLVLNISLAVIVLLLPNETSSQASNIEDSRRSLHKVLALRRGEQEFVSLDRENGLRAVKFDRHQIELEQPKIKIFNKEKLEAGHEISVGCSISRSSFPHAKVFWVLDTQLLNKVHQLEETFQEAEGASIVSIIQWNVTIDDNNRNLICKAHQPGYNEAFTTAEHKLVINSKPIDLPTKVFNELEIEDSVDVSVTFQANPKPSSLIWFVGSKKIYYGTETSKYVSREITAEPNSAWSASLNIKNLTLEDMQLNYTLRVANSLGYAKYHFLLKAKDLEKDELTTIEGDDALTTTISSLFEETETEAETTMSEVSQNEEALTTQESFELLETTTMTYEPVDTTSFDTSANEPFTILDVEIIEWTTNKPHQSVAAQKNETKFQRMKSKTKVSRVAIFKRPVLKNATKSDTNSSVSSSDPSQTSEDESTFSLFLIESASKAIVFWKSTLMLLVISSLVVSLFYYRRRVETLKAEIIEKNLGNSENRSCSLNRSLNAYTPTYFAQNVAPINVKELDQESRCEATNSSNYNLPTYNSSLHSYVSIDALSNDHIYEEIPFRKGSVASIYNKDNCSDDESITCRSSNEHLDYMRSFESNLPNLCALINLGYEPCRAKDFSGKMESTYI